MKTSDIESLLWASLIIAIGGAILFVWNSPIPAPLLWVGYIGVVIGAALLIRWWIGVMR